MWWRSFTVPNAKVAPFPSSMGSGFHCLRSFFFCLFNPFSSKEGSVRLWGWLCMAYEAKVKVLWELFIFLLQVTKNCSDRKVTECYTFALYVWWEKATSNVVGKKGWFYVSNGKKLHQMLRGKKGDFISAMGKSYTKCNGEKRCFALLFPAFQPWTTMLALSTILPFLLLAFKAGQLCIFYAIHKQPMVQGLCTDVHKSLH